MSFELEIAALIGGSASGMRNARPPVGTQDWLALFCSLGLTRLTGPYWPGWITRESWPS